MKIKQIENILTEAGIESNEAKIEAKMLIKHFVGISDVDLFLNEEFEVSEDLFAKIETAAKSRAHKRVPIQHIIGTAHFMGEDFIVNENVLIPRDETEILVRKAVEIINNNSFKLVLDIGTGSGCIACMVAKLSQAQVIGVDISTAALQVAIDNSSKLVLFNKAVFRKSDVFSNVGEKFDVIISNPPYIPPTEKGKLQIEVSFDPDLALFATDIEGIEFYDKISSQASEFLVEGGYLMFELGIGQGELVKTLMDKNGFKDVQLEKDLASIDRIIWGRK